MFTHELTIIDRFGMIVAVYSYLTQNLMYMDITSNKNLDNNRIWLVNNRDDAGKQCLRKKKTKYWFQQISKTWKRILQAKDALPEIWDFVSNMKQRNK